MFVMQTIIGMVLHVLQQQEVLAVEEGSLDQLMQLQPEHILKHGMVLLGHQYTIGHIELEYVDLLVDEVLLGMDQVVFRNMYGLGLVNVHEQDVNCELVVIHDGKEYLDLMDEDGVEQQLLVDHQLVGVIEMMEQHQVDLIVLTELVKLTNIFLINYKEYRLISILFLLGNFYCK